jgi:hypothetical protein
MSPTCDLKFKLENIVKVFCIKMQLYNFNMTRNQWRLLPNFQMVRLQQQKAAISLWRLQQCHTLFLTSMLHRLWILLTTEVVADVHLKSNDSR